MGQTIVIPPITPPAPGRCRRGLMLVLMLTGLLVGGLSPAAAQDGGQGQPPESRQAESLDPAVARDLLAAYENLQNERPGQAVTQLDALLAQRGDSMKPFDRASVLQIRGSALVGMDRFDRALADFAAALELNALPPEQTQQLRFNLAQLHFRQENHRQAIRYLEPWMAAADEPGDNAYYMLAAAHYFLDEYAQAVAPAEKAIQLSASAERRYYELANILYSQLDRPEPRVRLLSRMIRHWPDEAIYWKQLAALYNEMGRARDSFATLEVAYRNGLVDGEDDIVSLAQFYSLFDNPHRGAELLAREMQAGRVSRTVGHLETLSQLWSQAREHRKAIPVLREAAKLSDTGELSLRLGQVLFADEQYPAAETALAAAINKGGLDGDDRAETWLLLGTARFNQAGPGDRDIRARADKAFANAHGFDRTRDSATAWRRYIRAIDDTETRQASLEAEQAAALAAAAEQRALTTCRARRLSGRTLGEDCRERLASPGASPDTDLPDDADASTAKKSHGN